VNAEFNWWLLIVGLVVGAGLVSFVVADQRRREVDIDEEERAREALWLSTTLADEGYDVTPETVKRMLVLHRTYLEAPPPDPAPPPDVAPVSPDRPSELAGDDRRRIERGVVDLGE
jgi:hypothetical protein